MIKKDQRGPERPDLATQSWKNLKGFYRHNPKIQKIVGIVTENKLDKILHARTSHLTLNISPKHRYDALLDIVSVTVVEGFTELCYFEAKSGNKEIVTNDPGQLTKAAKNQIDRLIEKYKLIS